MQMKMEDFSHLGSDQLIVSGEERAGEVDQNRFVAWVPPHRTQPAGPHFTSRENNWNTGENSGDMSICPPTDVSMFFSWIMHDQRYLHCKDKIPTF